MKNPNEIRITTRDRLLRAWENSMELVRDFQHYANLAEDDPAASQMFADFAEDEGRHAAAFREILQQYQARGEM